MLSWEHDGATFNPSHRSWALKLPAHVISKLNIQLSQQQLHFLFINAIIWFNAVVIAFKDFRVATFR